MTFTVDPSASFGTILLTGYADQAFVVQLYTLTAEGTVAGTYDITEGGRVYSPLDCRVYGAYDAEMRPQWDSSQTVGLTVARTPGEPHNELTLSISAGDAATVQGWAVRGGVGSIHGVDMTGGRNPLGRWRWKVRHPSAART